MRFDICPWWLGHALANPVRRLWQDPARILKPYIREGMTILEPGCGMGFFTLEMARQVGPTGRVVAVDVQEQMLRGLRKRAERAGVADRLDLRLVPKEGGSGLDDLAGKVDFVLVFYMLHEVKDLRRFLATLTLTLKPEARILLAEPRGHVDPREFDVELDMARAVGLSVLDQPGGIQSRWALIGRS